MMESYDLTDFADCGMVNMTFNKDKSFWSYHVFELQFMLLKRLKATTEFEPQTEKLLLSLFQVEKQNKRATDSVSVTQPLNAPRSGRN